jgi:hypothetical protein
MLIQVHNNYFHEFVIGVLYPFMFNPLPQKVIAEHKCVGFSSLGLILPLNELILIM